MLIGNSLGVWPLASARFIKGRNDSRWIIPEGCPAEMKSPTSCRQCEHEVFSHSEKCTLISADKLLSSVLNPRQHRSFALLHLLEVMLSISRIPGMDRGWTEKLLCLEMLKLISSFSIPSSCHHTSWLQQGINICMLLKSRQRIFWDPNLSGWSVCAPL